jgi:RNA polymerase sigma-70 factor (ECF subfamily)
MSNIRKVYEKIYHQYIDKIYRYIFLRVNSQEVAEDLTSEAFMRGWDRFKNNKDKEDIRNIQAFLYQIARNLITDYYRERGQRQSVSAEYVSMTDPRINLEERAVIMSDLDLVKAALSGLKEEYREMIVLYYLEELRVPEIAKITNKSEETVRVQIHRALQALREELERAK